MELERVALTDEYFITRKLYPNVDFYSGVIYKAMGFPTEYFTVLFALPRFTGWMSHWNEFIEDPDNKIVRPRQVYLGERARNFVSMRDRQPEELAPYLFLEKEQYYLRDLPTILSIDSSRVDDNDTVSEMSKMSRSDEKMTHTARKRAIAKVPSRFAN